MNRIVTIYGDKVDEFGMPIPYHRYFIVEGLAPWAGANVLVASVIAITDCPLPNPSHFIVNNGAEGEAVAAAVAAIQALPANAELNII